MKTMSSLTIFIIFLLLSNVLLLNLSKGKNNKLTKFEMTKFKEVSSSSSLNTANQDDNSDKLPAIPDYNNKGFKCVQAASKIDKSADLCAFYDQICVSSGAVLFGPDDKGNYEVVLKTKGESVTCNNESFALAKDTATTNKKCYTTEIINKFDIPKDNPIPVNFFQHRICVNKTFENKFRFVRQFESINCTTKDFSSIDTISKDCYCVSIYMPKIDDSIKPFFFPVRIINNGFQCKKTLGISCDTYSTRKNCLGSIQGNLDTKKFDKLDSDLNMFAISYFFNRWICPNESGLDVAVLFQLSENKKDYSISCLGRKGEDCFYDENAKEACKRITNCPEAKSEFIAVECGSPAYKSIWDHDGYNTPLNTFCKRANGWLRFDSKISITEDKKRAVMMSGNGANSCIVDPNKPTECLSDDNKLLQKALDYYEANPSNYNNLLVCSISNIPESVTDKNHWCVKPLISPDNKGKFALDLNSLQS
jgi:hypothetical protein